MIAQKESMFSITKQIAYYGNYVLSVFARRLLLFCVLLLGVSRENSEPLPVYVRPLPSAAFYLPLGTVGGGGR